MARAGPWSAPGAETSADSGGSAAGGVLAFPSMSEQAVPSPSWKRWVKIALGPALFVAVELFFRPTLDLSGDLAAGHGSATPDLVRHALAATLWIAAWWFTEAVPIPVTSLLPVVLFPLLGLSTAQEVSRQYAHELIFLFLGGVLLAMAMERTGLHERIAVRIIRLFGQGRRSLVLGFMVATAAMSMWISNTATTIMLLPVALAVLSRAEGDSDGVDQAFPVALLLGIAFGANIGGLGTPVGSPPNILFQNIYHEKTGQEVSFGQWMLYGVPLILVLLPLTWRFLVRGLGRDETTSKVELPRLGALRGDQRWVMILFSVTALLWITRGDLGELRGWGSRLAEYGIVLKDSTVAIGAAVLLFIVPGRDRGPILDWSVSGRLPWGILLLLGAGFAISQAFDHSGLTLWVGMQLEGFGRLDLDPTLLLFLLIAAVVAISIVVTEFASNTASANILLPIIFGASVALGPERFPPDLLMISCALACTTGFAVPAGTPPNAIVFSTGRISIGRFARTGVLVDVFSLVLIVLLMAAARILSGS
jgi:sodium-dependent dicarboxylate transporter 2/3/5